jgi:hypothetical protein
MASTGSNSSATDDAPAAGAEIVVALTSHNDVATIGAAARALRDGLTRSFGSSVARFVLADAGSTDGTRDAVREALGRPALEVEFDRGSGELPYHGEPWRAAALRAILDEARRLHARACVVVDARVHTVEPDWIERLVAPVLTAGFDYVSPFYLRQANEGDLTRGIVYPVFRALYGVRLRQPAAREFGCSGRFLEYGLEQDFWDADQAPVGIDLWLAVAAVCNGLRTCEAALGTRGASAPAAPADLSTTLAQIVGALFADVEQRADVWQRVRGSVAIPVLGVAPAPAPATFEIRVDRLVESLRLGYRELREIWARVLPPRTIVELRRLTELAPDQMRFDDRLWASIVYDFALGWSMRVMAADHLLRSLTPLYSGWLASFLLELANATPAQADERTEQLCLAFELEKRYLISRWRWPQRPR